MGKNFKAAASLRNHRNLEFVIWRIVVQDQNAISQFASPFTRNILT
jgi:hypothetical protein